MSCIGASTQGREKLGADAVTHGKKLPGQKREGGSSACIFGERPSTLIDSQTNHPSSSSRRLGAGSGAPALSVVGRRT